MFTEQTTGTNKRKTCLQQITNTMNVTEAIRMRKIKKYLEKISDLPRYSAQDNLFLFFTFSNEHNQG